MFQITMGEKLMKFWSHSDSLLLIYHAGHGMGGMGMPSNLLLRTHVC